VTRKKVVVLGSGKIGKLVSFLLAESGDYEVTAVDAQLSVAEQAIRLPSGKQLPHARAAAADFSSQQALRKVMQGHQYVLSCAPYHCNTGIAAVARELGVHYLDLTEDVATTKAVAALSTGSDVAFIPQCGLAPGFITIVAASLGARFDDIESVKMRVGALPIYPHNRMKYNLTWSTEGLINEYGNPCEAVVAGKLALVQPLEGHETFSFDGVEYEAFNTSGGLGTLAETWEGKVKSLDYKSVRYPGHRDILALLMNDLKMNDDRDTLRRIFENALPYTKQDVVLIFVTATGKKDGRYQQLSYAKKIYNADIGGEHWGAIQITTAAGLCGVLDLHAKGELPHAGFVRQEDVSFEKFLSNRFGKYYA
jgi:saccharopine dehydrogenase-like NADP-dependent oxidoreductase